MLFAISTCALIYALFVGGPLKVFVGIFVFQIPIFFTLLFPLSYLLGIGSAIRDESYIAKSIAVIAIIGLIGSYFNGGQVFWVMTYAFLYLVTKAFAIRKDEIKA